MENKFYDLSESLLLNLLQEPGWFSFFPSSFFWSNKITDNQVSNIFKSFFKDKLNYLNLYIHIPFCSKICSYCNCFKITLNNEIKIDKYIDFLWKEAYLMYLYNNETKIKVKNIFIWWWTPNILNVEQLEVLFSIINKYFDISELWDFLIDCHPNYLDKFKIDVLKKYGITRITLAIQTLNENVLKLNNRDIYNEENIVFLVDYIKNNNIKINIDLLIWLKWQNYDIIKYDIDYFNNLNVDNISDHFLMLSNNIKYDVSKDYHELLQKVKLYINSINIKKNSQNILENDFVSKKSSIISLWAYWVSSLFWNIIFKKPWLNWYYSFIENNKYPVDIWMFLSEKIEMIKYVYLNILYWININEFYDIFWKDIFLVFLNELKFLSKEKIIYKEKNKIYSTKSDLETYIYFNIFLLSLYKNNKTNYLNKKKWNLFNYFFEDWTFIDR